MALPTTTWISVGVSLSMGGAEPPIIILKMDPLLWLSAAAIVAAILVSIPLLQRLFLGKREEPVQDGGTSYYRSCYLYC